MPSAEVSEQVAATPRQVWQLVHDPVEMSGLMAECIEMQWTDGSSGPAVGATFRGRNRSGWRRRTTTCTIVRYEPGALIAWDVSFGPLAVARCSYLVEPGASAAGHPAPRAVRRPPGSGLRAVGPLVRGTRGAQGRNRANMTATLARSNGRAEA